MRFLSRSFSIIWNLAASGFFFFTIQHLHKAYLEIKVFGYDYNWMYTALFTFMTLYVIFYIIYLNRLIADSKISNHNSCTTITSREPVIFSEQQNENSNG